MTTRILAAALCLLLVAGLLGCNDKDVDTLVLISPHNTDIEQAFEKAFAAKYLAETGRTVVFEWRDVGGGGSKILEYLRNVYGRADTAQIDIVWGGGEDPFMKMADEGILQKMQIPAGAQENIPARLAGLPLYDKDGYWCGAALGGFGFIYNDDLLQQLGVAPPTLWQDLGADRFFDRVALADPMKSSSVAAANENIVQSAEDWPAGWKRLMSILGNAKKYYNGASDAANAVINEVPVATCIDFYGYMRVFKYPKKLTYVSPAGQTVYTPDPIAILKNAPHPELAQKFVDFVLSEQGQALWCLPPGHADGPEGEPLFRMPIRKDVYAKYAGEMVKGISNPYDQQGELQVDIDMREVRYGLLKHLVKAAAVDNLDLIQQAKKKLIDAGHPAEMEAIFYKLPEDVRTREQIADLAGKLNDDVQRELITSRWREFFAGQYREVLAR